MPIVHFHLSDDRYTQEQCEELLTEASELYCSVLSAPPERVRAFIQLYKPWQMSSACVPLSKGGGAAPYFEFIVLKGRSEEQRQLLLEGFTDLMVKILKADRATVRGACWPVVPENWGIGGVPASQLRKGEIESRKS